MLVNLVDNAVRYAKSTVVVSVRTDGAWAELAVTDDGPGIPENDRQRAFDRFARLDDARSRDGDEAGGAGLGLAIVRATALAITAARPGAGRGRATGGPGLRRGGLGCPLRMRRMRRPDPPGRPHRRLPAVARYDAPRGTGAGDGQGGEPGLVGGGLEWPG